MAVEKAETDISGVKHFWHLRCMNLSKAKPRERSVYMEILWTLIVGLIVGAVAKLLMPGKDPGGFIITSLLGVAGAFLAYFVGTNLGWYESGGAAGFIASVIGAVVLLAIYRAVAGRRHITHH